MRCRSAMLEAKLEGPADFEGWRRTARRLLSAGVAPQDVVWRADDERDLFFNPEQELPEPTTGIILAPRAFVETASQAALNGDPERFAVLYRLLWRLQSERRLMNLASDPDVARVRTMAKAVYRDIHKMHAFVRFRLVTDDDGAERFIAWHEPDHHIVEAAAPFFMRRFANMAWTILTPRRSADWNGEDLAFGPGAAARAAPGADDLEDVWRGYYGAIFNPARLNVKAMRAEMPKRFWRNLPEAALIKPLTEAAAARTEAMIAKEASAPVHRRGAKE